MGEKKRLYQAADRTWKTSVLFLTFRKNGEVPQGEIYNMHIPETIPFRGFGDMILKMDRIYDLLDYPQSELQMREWDDKEKWSGTPLESRENWYFDEEALQRYHTGYTGKGSFVYVETRFRRYGSWQGILQAGKRKLTYRSTLEFLHYMMGYVKEAEPSAAVRGPVCRKRTS